MKSLIQTLLIAVTVIWLTIPVTAYDFQVDGIYYRLLSVADGSCAVSAGDVPYEGVVEIPENVHYNNKTLRVTEIKTKTLKDCKNVTRIEMSDSITQIGNGAFQGCINLQFIQLSNNIEIINDDVFLDCASLEVLTLPEAVSSIGNDVIKGCSSIEVFNLPLSLVKMASLNSISCSKLS